MLKKIFSFAVFGFTFVFAPGLAWAVNLTPAEKIAQSALLSLYADYEKADDLLTKAFREAGFEDYQGVAIPYLSNIQWLRDLETLSIGSLYRLNLEEISHDFFELGGIVFPLKDLKSPVFGFLAQEKPLAPIIKQLPPLPSTLWNFTFQNTGRRKPVIFYIAQNGNATQNDTLANNGTDPTAKTEALRKLFVFLSIKRTYTSIELFAQYLSIRLQVYANLFFENFGQM